MQKTFEIRLYDPVPYELTTCSALSTSKGPTSQECANEYAGTNNRDLVKILETQGYQTWTPPKTGTYLFEAAGAAGGGKKNSDSETLPGGKGAVVRRTLTVTQTEKRFIVVVGQQGESHSSYPGGGGGSFVMSEDRSAHPGEYTSIPDGTTKLVANAVLIGGGGAGYSLGAPSGRMDASHTVRSKDGQISGGKPGYGAPDAVDEYFAGPGGAGLISNGAAGFKEVSDSGAAFFAASILNGAGGGTWTKWNSINSGSETEEGDGGFGGGASGAKSIANGDGCGGPGGGYSGGGACGAPATGESPYSGGGGSYVGTAFMPHNTDQTSTGFTKRWNPNSNGYVRIWFLGDH